VIEAGQSVEGRVLEMESTSGVGGCRASLFETDFLDDFEEAIMASIDDLLNGVKSSAPDVLQLKLDRVLEMESTSGVGGCRTSLFETGFLDDFEEDVMASIDDLLNEVKNSAPDVLQACLQSKGEGCCRYLVVCSLRVMYPCHKGKDLVLCRGRRYCLGSLPLNGDDVDMCTCRDASRGHLNDHCVGD
jgi:hypothetical protein